MAIIKKNRFPLEDFVIFQNVHVQNSNTQIFSHSKEAHHNLIHYNSRHRENNNNNSNINRSANEWTGKSVIFARQKKKLKHCAMKQKGIFSFMNLSAANAQTNGRCQCILRCLMAFWCGNITFRSKKEKSFFVVAVVSLRVLYLILCFS